MIWREKTEHNSLSKEVNGRIDDAYVGIESSPPYCASSTMGWPEQRQQ